MSHSFQVSEIAHESDTSSSSEDEEAKVFGQIKEVVQEGEPDLSVTNRTFKHRTFLEDYDHPAQLKGTNLLSEPLLGESKNSHSQETAPRWKTRRSKGAKKPAQRPSRKDSEENEILADKSEGKIKSDPSKDHSKSNISVSMHAASKKTHPAVETASFAEQGAKESSEPKKMEEESEDDSEEEDSEEEKATTLIRTKKILRDVFPTFLFSVVQLLQETIVLQFVGHYCDSSEFAAVGKY